MLIFLTLSLSAGEHQGIRLRRDLFLSQPLIYSVKITLARLLFSGWSVLGKHCHHVDLNNNNRVDSMFYIQCPNCILRNTSSATFLLSSTKKSVCFVSAHFSVTTWVFICTYGKNTTCKGRSGRGSLAWLRLFISAYITPILLQKKITMTRFKETCRSL